MVQAEGWEVDLGAATAAAGVEGSVVAMVAALVVGWAVDSKVDSAVAMVAALLVGWTVHSEVDLAVAMVAALVVGWTVDSEVDLTVATAEMAAAATRGKVVNMALQQ